MFFLVGILSWTLQLFCAHVIFITFCNHFASMCVFPCVNSLLVCLLYLTKFLSVSARHPEEVIKRYRKVLKAHKKGRKLSVAYRKVGVDRNTVVANAPICELAVVAPKKYKELLAAHTPQQRLQNFAKKCLEVLINDPNLLRDVEHQKKKGKLIPLSKKA